MTETDHEVKVRCSRCGGVWPLREMFDEDYCVPCDDEMENGAPDPG